MISEISDTEMWHAHRRRSQEKRDRNRRQSLDLLREKGIDVVEHNEGIHLVVDGRFDFWPGTGLWIERGTGARRRGVFELIKRVKGQR